MEELVTLLAEIKPETKEEELDNVFKDVATKLMSEFVIKKGYDIFQMVEIEFYWYSPNHRDLSVYPRKSEAGNWFLHPSGVDITLKSDIIKDDGDISDGDISDGDISKLRQRWENAKKNQEEDYSKKSSYGGILIRTLRKLTPNNDPANMDSFIVGPWNCSDALFDYLPCDGDADAVKFMLPIIEKKNIDGIMPNLKDVLPNDYICQALRSGIDDTHTTEFYNKPYCFYVNKQYVRGWEKGAFPNKPWNKRTQDLKLYNNV